MIATYLSPFVCNLSVDPRVLAEILGIVNTALGGILAALRWRRRRKSRS